MTTRRTTAELKWRDECVIARICPDCGEPLVDKHSALIRLLRDIAGMKFRYVCSNGHVHDQHPPDIY